MCCCSPRASCRLRGSHAGPATAPSRIASCSYLHVAYAFVPMGFLLLGGAVLWPSDWPTSAALHAWTGGAFGLMTLAVMTRASLATPATISWRRSRPS